MKSCYYAHCVAIYDTPQERRDVELLEALGFEVYNPNNEIVDNAVKEMKAAGVPDYMAYFKGLVGNCTAFAFRALPDGRIPAGVAKEIEYAREFQMPILELPSGIHGRTMCLDGTREYLREVGQR